MASVSQLPNSKLDLRADIYITHCTFSYRTVAFPRILRVRKVWEILMIKL